MELKIEYVPIDSIKPYAGNAKLHPQEQIDQIKRSIELLGFDDPIAVWQNNEIIEGHGRLLAAQQLGMTEVPIIRLDDLTDEQRRAYALIHNKLTMNSGFDMEILNLELANIGEIDMGSFDFEVEPLDFGDDTAKKPNTGEQGSLARDFLIPPFSIFDTRGGTWLERKRQWREIIKDDATTRGTAQLMAGNIESYEGQGGMAPNSLLDPVLAEIIVSWFMPQNGLNVFDTFAGDTVFGFVAGYKGKHFTGLSCVKNRRNSIPKACRNTDLMRSIFAMTGGTYASILQRNLRICFLAVRRITTSKFTAISRMMQAIRKRMRNSTRFLTKHSERLASA